MTDKSACYKIAVFSNRQAAERAAAYRRQAGENVRPVACPVCRNWHLGEGRK